MAFGKIPRFSPSFSLAEAAIAARHLLRPPEDEPVVRRFERAFAERIGVPHAIMVPSARYGLHLILQGWGLQPGDEIIVPALTYFAIPAFIKAMGLKPVFVDIGLTTHVIDPGAIEAAITPRTRAVVPTHLFGTPCDLDAVVAIARRHGLKVIEDVAQASGARYKGRMVGSFGDAAYYTFGLTKNITTLSGAMVTTWDEALAAAVRAEVDAGQAAGLERSAKETATGLAIKVATHPYVYPFTLHPLIVVGNRLGQDPIHDRFGEAERTWDSIPAYYKDERPRAVQAAVGLKQLERLEELNGARIRNGRFLDENLANVPGLVVPSYPPGAEPIYMSFVVHHRDRDGLAAALRRRGVDTTVGYMSNCAQSKLFPDEAARCPNAERAFADLLHLPVHPNLSDADRRHLCEAVRQAVLEIGP